MSAERRKVLVALSGGLDSAATVVLLQEEGFEVEALYLDILDDQCAREKAQATACMLGIKLHIAAIDSLFRATIIQYTLDEHEAGRTPAPCSLCNPTIKWSLLAQWADRLECPYIATGHYIQIEQIGRSFFVKRGIDPAKDQSYYLWRLPQSILQRAITPLGRYTKIQIREYLSRRGFEDMASSGESMSICFLGGRSYSDFIKESLGSRVTPGEIQTPDGEVVGYHNGYQLYTIGQKRGFTLEDASQDLLGGAAVVAIKPKSNTVIVSRDQKHLLSNTLWGENWKAVNIDQLLQSDTTKVMIRGIGRNPSQFCRITLHPENGLLRIELSDSDPAWAPAIGQPMTFYIGDLVVGGAYMTTAPHEL